MWRTGGWGLINVKGDRKCETERWDKKERDLCLSIRVPDSPVGASCQF